MNQLGVIYPYVNNGLWVFDDPSVGLVKEPFIAGIDTMLDELTAGIKDAQNGFRLVFSAGPFPDYTMQLNWVEEDKPITKALASQGFTRGNWYVNPETGMEGWLCPALLKYFDKAPKQLFVKLEEAVGQRPVYKRRVPVVAPARPRSAYKAQTKGSWIERQLGRLPN